MVFRNNNIAYRAYRPFDIKQCSLGIPVGEVDACRCAERQDCGQRPYGDAERTCPRKYNEDSDHDIREACWKEVCDGAMYVQRLSSRWYVKNLVQKQATSAKRHNACCTSSPLDRKTGASPLFVRGEFLRSNRKGRRQ